MMSSVWTLRLNRRSAFSSGSPSCRRTSAKLVPPHVPGNQAQLQLTAGLVTVPRSHRVSHISGTTPRGTSQRDLAASGLATGVGPFQLSPVPLALFLLFGSSGIGKFVNRVLRRSMLLRLHFCFLSSGLFF